MPISPHSSPRVRGCSPWTGRLLSFAATGALGLAASCQARTPELGLDQVAESAELTDDSKPEERTVLLSSFLASGPLTEPQSTAASREPLIGTHRVREPARLTWLTLMQPIDTAQPVYRWIRADSLCGQREEVSVGYWDMADSDLQLYPIEGGLELPVLATSRVQLVDDTLVLSREGVVAAMDYEAKIRSPMESAAQGSNAAPR